MTQHQPQPAGDVTRLLARSREGDEEALEELVPLLYRELRQRAERQLARERGPQTLAPTGLVHEAYVKLIDQRERNWQNKSHFLAVAATVMRRILVHRAEARVAQKRGGGRRAVTLEEGAMVFDGRAEDVLALDEALTRLAVQDPNKARLVELRFFGGYTTAETAEILEISTRSVERGWRFARAWLQRELAE